jgi:uncharacterized membrane protein
MSELIFLLIVLAFLGVINAGYLSWKAVQKKPLVCPINQGSCNSVVESNWNKIFFVKNEFLGLVFYLAVMFWALVLFFKHIELIKLFLLVGTGLSVLFSAFLVYIQIKVIKEYCFYCMISASLSLLIFLDVILLYFLS